MTGTANVASRRAIESLRSGVPSAAAVEALGWHNSSHSRRFENLLAQVDKSGSLPGGLILKGDFGTGKSHLLQYLEHIGLSNNFVVSKVVISKETQLFNTNSVMSTAIRDAKIPGRRGAIFHELAPLVDFKSPLVDDLAKWSLSAPGMFAASLHLLQRVNQLNDEALISCIIDWWSGEKLSPSAIKGGLKKIGSVGMFEVKAIKAADLALIRIELANLIIKACGFKGWVILFDELELIGRYSSLQRGKSYIQLARWFGQSKPITGSMICVGAITDDFSQVILHEEGRNDRVRAVSQMLERGNQDLADEAVLGMDLIDATDALYLSGPDQETLTDAYRRVYSVYERAFGWTPPQSPPIFSGTTIPMRTYIKTWIYSWDLQRLGLVDLPNIESETIKQDYAIDATLEESSEEPDVEVGCNP
jgi:hypothetical protein